MNIVFYIFCYFRIVIVTNHGEPLFCFQKKFKEYKIIFKSFDELEILTQTIFNLKH